MKIKDTKYNVEYFDLVKSNGIYSLRRVLALLTLVLPSITLSLQKFQNPKKPSNCKGLKGLIIKQIIIKRDKIYNKINMSFFIYYIKS